MKITDIKIGTSVFIDIKRGEESFSLKTMVQDIISNGLVVYAPSKDDTLFLFEPSDVVGLSLSEDAKLIRWDSSSYNSLYLEGVPYLTITSSKDGLSLNRREGFRVNINQKLKFSLDTSELFDMELLDVSLMGVGFRTTKEIAIGSTVFFTLQTEFGSVPLVVKVVRPLPSNSKTLLAYGAAIIGDENAKLSKFVTTKQQQQLRQRRLSK
jgi:hypothetical protein